MPDKQDRSSRVAGRYRIEAELARGGMGTVYRAWDESTAKPVALKRLKATTDDRIAKLFQREYYTLAQLQHPRIIEVYDYGVDAEGSYSTMELLDGADLRELAPLGTQEACRHLRDVASSLALLHARRLIHRDVSARNVRIAGDGHAKLIDFGALTPFGIAPQIVGTPPGVPPEALHGLDLDQRADLYGLGALAYWVLTGRHAYPARELRALPAMWRRKPPEPPSVYAEGVPPELDDLVLSLLSPDVLGRPRSAADVIERLDAIADLPPEPALEVGSSYLTNPELVGRETELRRIKNFAAGLSSGRSSGLIVTGPAGVGRTRLLSEGALEVQLLGGTVARVDAEVHRGPYATIRAAVQTLLEKIFERVTEAAQPHAALIGHIIPELAEAAGVTDRIELPRDRGEQRLRIQQALVSFLSTLAADQPVVVAVDNAHAADESSLAVLAVLLKSSSEQKVAVWLSARDDETPAAPELLATLRSTYPELPLKGLAPDDTTALVQALFGRVEHTARLGRWLHDRTGGNPTYCLALASQLVDSKSIVYRDGSWVLPAELPAELSRVALSDLHEQRVSRLSSTARTVAENLSVEQGAVGLDECIALSGLPDEAAFSALAELVSEGILLASDADYRFSHGALRDHLFSELGQARRRDLHRRAAHFLLQAGSDDPLVKIDAGWHLMHGGEELRGAELLDEASRKLVTTIEGLRHAAPALEAALAVYERTNKSPWVLLPILDALTAAGWYVDHQYVEKYGDRTLDLSLELSGLALAEKLSRFLGEQRALKVALAIAAARHATQKKHITYKLQKKFQGVFAPLVGSVGIMIGVAANTFNGAEARRVLTKARMMRAFEPGHVLSVMYNYARYFTLAAEGRFGEAEPIAPKVLEWFESSKGKKVLTEEGAKALSGGIMTGIGQFAAFRDDTDGEQWATRLEELGLSFYEAMGTQIRFVHHMMRGRTEKARPHLEQLELQAIRGGTTWQSSIIIPTVAAGVSARSGDLVRLRQMTELLERRGESLPIIKAYSAVYRAYWELLRGRKHEALREIEPVVSRTGTHQWSEWVLSLAAHARALIALGRTSEARRIVRAIDAGLKPEDDPYVVTTLEGRLVAAEVEAAEGNLQVAAKQYDELIERHRPNEAPLTLCRLYEARARLALQAFDEEKFGESLSELERWARKAENPVLVAKHKRLEAEARRAFARHSGGIASPSLRPDSFASAVRSLLETKEGPDRAQTALRLAVERSGARGGYLYVGDESSLQLVAKEPANETPPMGFTEEVLAMVAQAGKGTDGLDIATATVGTGMPSAIKDVGDLHTELLVAPHAGGTVVVGAVVLKRPVGSALQPLGLDMIEAMAQALQSTKSSAETAFTSEESSELFGDG